jgi:POT family proton-dependent oligopeptide transporter
VKRHPRGLFVLAGTEFWDRISFHGMQALLVLYMVGQLLVPGHIEHIVGLTRLRGVIEGVVGPLSPQALASQIFGLYVGLIYFTPIFGGLLGDRLLGRRLTVTLGALLMTAGHFCMGFEPPFLLGLILLILGAGCLRGNLVAQVGELFSKDDHRRDSGYQLYYTMLNMGAFIAPLVTGALAQAYGWRYGFGLAGFGMLAGLLIYLVGQRALPREAPRRRAAVPIRLEKHERRVVLVLILMLPLMTLYWIAQSQIWNVYNLWARDYVDLVVAAWHVPVPWFQAFEPLSVIVMMPPTVLLWRWQARRSREPDDLAKMAMGFGLLGAAMVWLAASNLVVNAAGKVPLIWTAGFFVIEGVAYVYVVPTVIALFSRSAPAAVNAMMLGASSLSVFAASAISGRLGGSYESLSPGQFWLLHAAIVATGGVILVLGGPGLRRELLTKAV